MMPFNALLPLWRVVVFVVLHILLVGCADVVRTSDPTEEATSLIQQIMELKPGMSRNEVHSMVGEPYATSEHLKYEIYQYVGETKEYWGIAPIPYIPFFSYQEKDYIPILFVIYNDDWTIKAYEWDLYRESDTTDRKNVHIELDGYILIRNHSSISGLMLFAPTELSKQVIMESSLDHSCNLYLIGPDQPFKDRYKNYLTYHSELFLNDRFLFEPYGLPNIAIPGEPAFDPAQFDKISEAFIVVQLSPGIYELELRGLSSVKGRMKGSFECVAGEAYYADIHAEFSEVVPWNWKYKYRMEGEIHISDDWPNKMKNPRQVLIFRDEWYGLDYQK